MDDVSLRGSRGVFVCERKRLVGCWAGSEESRRAGGVWGGESQTEAEGPEPVRIPPQPDQEPRNRQADSPSHGAGHTRSDSREDGPEPRPSVALCRRAPG